MLYFELIHTHTRCKSKTAPRGNTSCLTTARTAAPWVLRDGMQTAIDKPRSV
jgi:hypothetical protein